MLSISTKISDSTNDNDDDENVDPLQSNRDHGQLTNNDLNDISTILVSGCEIHYKTDGVESHSHKYIKSAIVTSVFDFDDGMGTRLMLNTHDQIDPIRHMISISKFKIPSTGELIVNPRQKWMRLKEFTVIPDVMRVRQNQDTMEGSGNRAKRLRVSRGLADYNIQAQRRSIHLKHSKLDEPQPSTIHWQGISLKEKKSATQSINHYYKLCANLGLIERFYKSKITTSSNWKEFTSRRDSLKRSVIQANKDGAFDLKIQSSLSFYQTTSGDRRSVTKRDLIVREAIFKFEYNNKCQRIKICPSCKENVMVNVRTKKQLDQYFTSASKVHPICDHCKSSENVTADSDYYEHSNRHPVWFEHNTDSGEIVLDSDGNKNAKYTIPEELQDLRIGEKLLIQRYSPYIPTHHIRNGQYGIKGHCVTFPQDITDVCNVLPQRKEKLLTFIRYMSNKDNTTPYPKQYVIRRQKVIGALKWLKIHHSGYQNITILESNLDWMGNDQTKNMAEFGKVVHTNHTSNDYTEEFVSKAHMVNEAHETISISTMHINEKKSTPSPTEAKPILELVKQKDDLGKLGEALHFPAIDVSQPVS